MKLYVPEIGDQLKLSADWTFDLHWERRNDSLIKHFFNETYDWNARDMKKKVMLPKDTILKVDRVYIRQGLKEFSSISFYVMDGPDIKKGRFWAKLADCNNLEFEVAELSSTRKFEFDLMDVSDGSHYSWYNHNQKLPLTYKDDGTVMEVLGVRNRKKVLITKLEHEITWREEKHGAPMGVGGYSHWYGTVKNPKYTLYDLSGKELGSWKSLASLKKNAKTYLCTV